MRRYFIKDSRGVEQPAWKHTDGTIVSYWDGFDKLLIKDDEGIREIDHSTAMELGYERQNWVVGDTPDSCIPLGNQTAEVHGLPDGVKVVMAYNAEEAIEESLK